MARAPLGKRTAIRISVILLALLMLSMLPSLSDAITTAPLSTTPAVILHPSEGFHYDAGVFPASSLTTSSYAMPGGDHHFLTTDEMLDLRQVFGVRDPTANYSLVIDGHLTGLAPPSESEYEAMVGTTLVIEPDASGELGIPGSYDFSTQPYFPQVRNQGGQGSCAAWALTYYAYGYLEAKDNGWTDAKTGNNAHLMSPAWTYNKVNGGYDSGSNMVTNARVIRDWGVASLASMPYDSNDDTSWGTEAAWREAPLHRASTYYTISYTGSATVDYVKSLVYSETPVTFTIDAYQYSPGFSDGNLIISSAEYDSFSMNHAQTIVGYDDSITDDGDVGAFRVVNSWGSGWGDSGYYWITYDTFKEIGSRLMLTYIVDVIDYQPSLVATWGFDVQATREASLEVGIGPYSTPIGSISPYFVKNADGYLSTFPQFMCLDITGFQGDLDSGNKNFYLELGTSDTPGELASFKIEHYQNAYVPGSPSQRSSESPDVPMVNPGYVTNILDGDSDTVPPNISITAPQEGQMIATSTLTITWSGSDGGSGIDHFEIRMDGGSWIDVGAQTSRVYQSLSDGDHTVQVLAFDGSGNSAMDSVTFVVDTQPPSLSIVSPSQGALLNTNSVTVTWSGSDAGTGIYQYEVRLDSNSWIDKDTGTSQVYSSLSQGSHTVYVRAYDIAGNVASDSRSFTVDSVPPSVSISSPSEAASLNFDDVTITWSGSDSGSGIDHYEARIDSGSWSNVATQLSISYQGLSDGGHIFSVKAVDKGGNTAEDSVNFFVDTLDPTVSLLSPSQAALLNTNSVTVTWSGSDTGTGIDHFEVRLDSDSWIDKGTGTSHVFYSLPQGSHTVYVRAIDEAGNSATDSRSFTVDSLPPAISISAPSDGVVIDAQEITVIWSCSDSGSGIHHYEAQLDNGPWSNLGSQMSVVYSGLSEGTHNIGVRAIDVAGNVNSDSVTFVVDTQPPSLYIVSPSQGALLNINSVTVTWSGSDTGTGIDHFEVRLDSGSWINRGTGTSQAYSSLSQGSHTVYVRAYDNAGNSLLKSRSFSVDSIAPTVTVLTPGDGAILPANQLTVTWTGSDSGSGIDHFELKIDQGSWISKGLLESSALTLSQGDHTIWIKAVDKALNFALDSIGVSVDTSAPSVSINSPLDGQVCGTSTLAVQWSAQEAGSGIDRFEMSLDGGQWSDLGISTSVQLNSLAEGEHQVGIRVYDLAGNVGSDDLSFVVDTLPPAVWFLSPQEGSHHDSSSIPISWSGGDQGSGIVGYHLLVDGSIEIDLGLSLSYTLTSLSDGTHTARITALDGGGNQGTATLTFSVDTTSPTVNILSPEEGEKVQTSEVTVQWEGMDQTTGIVEFMVRIDGGDWVNMGLANSTVTNPLSDDIHQLEVRAADEVGNSASDSVTFIVWTGSLELEIISPQGGTHFDVDQVDVQWDFSGSPFGLDHFEVRLDSESWINVGSQTSHLFSSLTTKEHTVWVRALDGVENEVIDSVEFFVDTVAPTILISSPLEGASLESASVFVEWIVTDAGSGMLAVELKLDSNSWMLVDEDGTHIFTSVASGDHTISISATDLAGNNELASVNFTVIVLPLSVEILSPADGALIGVSEFTAQWSGTDNGVGISHFEIRIDVGGWLDVGALDSYLVTQLSDGPHHIEVRVVDINGGLANDSVQLLVDTAPPEVEIIEPAQGWTSNQTDAEFKWSGLDDTSGVDYYQYRIDGSTWTITEGVSIYLQSLGDGGHVFDVRAFDLIGHNATASVEFTIDATPPVIMMLSPTDGQVLGSTTIELSYSIEGLGPEGSVLVRVGSEDWMEAGSETCVISVPEEGVYALAIKAIDSLGNTAICSLTITADITPPELVIVSPVNGSVVTSTDLMMEWTCVDLWSDIVQCEVSVDGASWETIGLCNQYQIIGMEQGYHTISLRVSDAALNEIVRTVGFTINTVLPDLMITSPVDGSYVNTTSLPIIWTISDVFRDAEMELSLDGSDWMEVFGGSMMLQDLTEGPHSVGLRVKDAAGNTATANVSFTVDTLPPVISILEPEDGSVLNVTSILIEWEYLESADGISRALVMIDGTQVSELGSETSYELSSLDEGEHTVSIVAFDKAGNSHREDVEILVDITPPEIMQHSPVGTGINVNSAIRVTFSETMDKDSVRVGIEGVTGIVAWNECEFILVPEVRMESGHTYRVEVTGQDLAGNTMGKYTWSFTTVTMDLIFGRVVGPENLPIVGAVVTLENGDHGITDSEGRFSFETTTGVHTMTIYKDGYRQQVIEVEVMEGGTEILGKLQVMEPSSGDIDLTQLMLILAPLLVGISAVCVYKVRKRR